MKTENNAAKIIADRIRAKISKQLQAVDLEIQKLKIAYQNDDTGDDYCSECYEAIQDDQKLLKETGEIKQ